MDTPQQKEAKRIASVPPRKQSRRMVVRAVSDHTSVALLEFQSPTAALVAEPVPVSARYTTWIIASLVLVTGILLTVCKVDRVVPAIGKLVPTSVNMVVQPLETSIVRSVRVRVGQVVHAGDLLAELDPTFSGTDDKATTAQAGSLAAEVARLRSELAGKAYHSDGTSYGDMQERMAMDRRQQFDFHTASLRAKIESAKVKVAQAQAAVDFANSRLVGLRDVEARRAELERLQVGSHLNTLSARDSRLQMEAQLADSQKMRESAARDWQGAEADLSDYAKQANTETSQTLSQQERALSDMLAQSGKAQRRHELVSLKANADAIVLSIAKVSPGSVMQSGDEFIRLVPLDSPMEVDAAIPANMSGFVHVGDPVVLKFDTFPYMQYGNASGRVELLSADSFATPADQSTQPSSRADVSAQSPNSGPQSGMFYRAKMSLLEMHMRNVPANFRLDPGMPVSADIHVGRRSVMAAMFARVAPLAAEGLRDP